MMNMVNRLKMVFIAVLIGLAMAPAPASATDMLPTFESVGIQHWGGGQLPPCGQPVFHWVDDDTLNGEHQEYPQGVQADADPNTCVIQFAVRNWHKLWIQDMCEVVVHEIGHLYGHEHSEGGVMSESMTPWQRTPCALVIRVTRRWYCRSSALGYTECHRVLALKPLR
jgi:hypothetical protein